MVILTPQKTPHPLWAVGQSTKSVPRIKNNFKNKHNTLVGCCFFVLNDSSFYLQPSDPERRHSLIFILDIGSNDFKFRVFRMNFHVF